MADVGTVKTGQLAELFLSETGGLAGDLKSMPEFPKLFGARASLRHLAEFTALNSFRRQQIRSMFA
jgi:hypothetical protein